MKYILLFLLIILTSVMYAQVTDHSNWKTYTDKRFYSSIAYPANWVLAAQPKEGSYVLYAPKSDTDKF